MFNHNPESYWQVYQDDNRHNILTTTLPPSTTLTSLDNQMSINEHMRDKMTSAVSRKSSTASTTRQESSRGGRRGLKNRMALRSGGYSYGMGLELRDIYFFIFFKVKRKTKQFNVGNASRR